MIAALWVRNWQRRGNGVARLWSALQSVGHTGLGVFLGGRLPAKFQGPLRGLIIRVIKSRKFVRAWLFKLQYPLPQLVVIESDHWWKDSRPMYPVRIVRFEALGESRLHDPYDANAIRSSEPEMTPLKPMCGFLNRWSQAYSFVMRQPVIGIVRIGQTAKITAGKPLAEQIDQVDQVFIDELNSSALTKSHRKRGRALIIVAGDEHSVNGAGWGIAPHVSSLGTPVSFLSPTAWLTHWRPEEGGEPSDTPGFADRSEDVFFSRLRAEVQFQTIRVSQRARPPIVQVVKTSAAGSTDEGSFGFGDILLGAALVFEEAEGEGRLPLIDWSGFSAHDALSIAPDTIDVSVLDLHQPVCLQLGSDVPVDFSWETRVFTNRRPLRGFSSRARDFLFRYGASPSSEVSQSVEKFLAAHGLEERGYDVIHVRFGDDDSQKTDISERIFSGLDQLASSEGNYVVMSDHPQKLHRYTAAPSFTIRDGAPIHSGRGASPEEFAKTLEDFFLIGKSRQVFVLSRYAWGSGFSSTAADLFGVPLTPWVTHRTSHYLHD